MERNGYIDGTSYKYSLDIGTDDVHKEDAHVNIKNYHSSRVGRLEVYPSRSVRWSSTPTISATMTGTASRNFLKVAPMRLFSSTTVTCKIKSVRINFAQILLLVLLFYLLVYTTYFSISPSQSIIPPNSARFW